MNTFLKLYTFYFMIVSIGFSSALAATIADNICLFVTLLFMVCYVTIVSLNEWCKEWL